MADIQANCEEYKACIIGAGPAGLAMARALKVKGIGYDQFEIHNDVGGIWDIERTGTPMYESAHFISSRKMSGFCGFPMPDHYPDYPSHNLILQFLKDFSKRYALRESITFGTSVTGIEQQDDDSWSVTLDTGEKLHYHSVVCATGSQWHPLMPEIEGEFTGEIRHSSTYWHGKEFDSKRVLIIGAGNSGCDIACDAGAFADKAFISMRRGYHFIPKHVFGMPTDELAATGPRLPVWLVRPVFSGILRLLVGDLARYGLKKPDHKLLETHPIMNSQLVHAFQHGDVTAKGHVQRLDGDYVVFEDGSREMIDLIICATGYTQHQSYAEGFFDYERSRPNLFLQMFSRKYRNLFATSFIETNAGAYKLFDLMSFAVASHLDDQRARRPAAQRMDALIAGPDPDLSGGIHFSESERHGNYFDSDTYKQYLRGVYKRMEWVMPEEAVTLLPPKSLQPTSGSNDQNAA